MKVFFFILFALFFTTFAIKTTYHNYQLWRLITEDSQMMESVQLLLEKSDVDVWASGVNYVDVCLSPEEQLIYKNVLEEYNVKFHVQNENIQLLINEESSKMSDAQSRAFDLENYNTFEDIELYLTNLSRTNALVELNSLGKTVEGRDMWQVTISTDFLQTKPAVWVDCGIHAREWISPSTCLFGIDLLANNYGSNSNVTNLLDTYDIYILPVDNPDGYSFTFTDTRLYRKNRKLWPGNSCIGTDLNRNSEDHWSLTGSSNNSCVNTYNGPFPVSENETISIQNGLTSLVSRLSAAFTLHSYSQYWMYPHAWTSQLPAEIDEMDRVARVGVTALTDVHNTPFTVGPWYTVLYDSSGTTMDFAYSLGITYTYTIELRPDSNAVNGFVLPPDQITPTGEETWAGIMAACMALP